MLNHWTPQKTETPKDDVERMVTQPAIDPNSRAIRLPGSPPPEFPVSGLRFPQVAPQPAAKPAATVPQENRPSGKLTVWNVMQAIPDSIGSFDYIAKKMNVPRMELRRFVKQHPELQEAIDDEMLNAREQLQRKAYEDAYEGDAQARQDFFKMVGGYFEKREKADGDGEEKMRVVIHMTEREESQFPVLGADGELTSCPFDDGESGSSSSSDEEESSSEDD